MAHTRRPQQRCRGRRVAGDVASDLIVGVLS